MVIMTVDEDGADNVANISQAVTAFKNHPAILMWALGNEWNLIRSDRSLYYAHYATLAEAAAAMQSNALLVKSLDSNHPVASVLGEINYPTAGDVDTIVNTVCTGVDVWGANIYRGSSFGDLFTNWASRCSKPLYLSEFGTDAFRTSSWSPWPPTGGEDAAMQSDFLDSLWRDMSGQLSADDPSRVCLGGTVFEWCDEWWKSSTGAPDNHDNTGYYTEWNPTAYPDSFANEEWFGVVAADRAKRPVYQALRNAFAVVVSSGCVLSLSSSPAGAGSVVADPAPGADGKYAVGTIVKLTAYPADGYTAGSWTGDVQGCGNSLQVTMTRDLRVTAQFEQAALPNLIAGCSLASKQKKGKVSINGSVNITNTGSTRANAFNVDVFFTPTENPADGTLLTTRKIRKLQPGKTMKLKVSKKLPTGSSVSGMRLVVRIDSTAAVQETVECDNTAVSDPLPGQIDEWEFQEQVRVSMKIDPDLSPHLGKHVRT